MAQKAKDAKKQQQIGIRLSGRYADLFAQFKENMGFESDAEAARVLIAARLGQLKRRGALAKAV